MTNAMQEYTEANVAGVGQLKLIIMLYEGARRFLLQAHDCIEKKRTMEAHEYLIKAKRIIVHFLCTTNPESSELAANLHKLYVFLYERIARANMCKSLEETEAALRILNKLLEGWKELHGTSTPNMPPHPSPENVRTLSIQA